MFCEILRLKRLFKPILTPATDQSADQPTDQSTQKAMAKKRRKEVLTHSFRVVRISGCGIPCRSRAASVPLSRLSRSPRTCTAAPSRSGCSARRKNAGKSIRSAGDDEMQMKRIEYRIKVLPSPFPPLSVSPPMTDDPQKSNLKIGSFVVSEAVRSDVVSPSCIVLGVEHSVSVGSGRDKG